ncbi:MAG: MlaD family protein [Bryobacteraceae bacterium]|jgi:phospholipid/cholesterol/gamma-HCH transport system substrate-binding protein
MPSPTKVAWSQLKVGIMAMIALAIVAVLVFLMTGANNPFSEKFTLYTYFPDSVAMTEGAAVRLNGILVGKVSGIELTGEANNKRAVRMTMEIDQRFRAIIPKDSEVGFGSENVLGTKYLNIERGQSPEHVQAGAEIKSKDEKDLMEMLQSASPLLESMQVILKRVDGLVAQLEAGKGSLGKLLYDEELYRKVNVILDDFQKVTHALSSGQGTLGAMLYDQSLYNEVRGTVKRLDSLLDGIQKGEGTAGKLVKDPALYDELKQSSTELKALLANLNAGKGTAGKLLTEDALHAEAIATLNRLNGTLDKLNAGQGTLGQLMVNPALYENLVGTSSEMNELMKSFRKNPKKFLTIQLKLF